MVLQGAIQRLQHVSSPSNCIDRDVWFPSPHRVECFDLVVSSVEATGFLAKEQAPFPQGGWRDGLFFPSSVDALISNAFDNHLQSYDAGFENYNITVNVDNDNNCITIKSSGKGSTAIRHPDDNVPVAIQAKLASSWSNLQWKNFVKLTKLI